jgi:hypothetical protein
MPKPPEFSTPAPAAPEQAANPETPNFNVAKLAVAALANAKNIPQKIYQRRIERLAAKLPSYQPSTADYEKIPAELRDDVALEHIKQHDGQFNIIRRDGHFFSDSMTYNEKASEPPLFGDKVASRLLDTGKSAALTFANHLSILHDVSAATANKYLDCAIADYLEKEQTDHGKNPYLLNFYGRVVISNLDSFSDLTPEVAQNLIRCGQINPVIYHMPKFQLEPTKELALEASTFMPHDREFYDAIMGNFPPEVAHDPEILSLLVKRCTLETPLSDRHLPNSVFDKTIILQAIRQNRKNMDHLIYYNNQTRAFPNESLPADHNREGFFTKIFDAEIAQAITEENFSLAEILNQSPALCAKLSPDEMKAIINSTTMDYNISSSFLRHAQFLTEHFPNSISFDKNLALRMTAQGGGKAVAEHLQEFTDLDKDVALAIAKSGHADEVFLNINKFNGFQPDADFARAIVMSDSNSRHLLLQDLSKFNMTTPQELLPADRPVPIEDALSVLNYYYNDGFNKELFAHAEKIYGADFGRRLAIIKLRANTRATIDALRQNPSYFGSSVEKIITKYQNFGAEISADILAPILMLEGDAEVPAELSDLGVTKTGAEGIKQFMAAAAEIKQQITNLAALDTAGEQQFADSLLSSDIKSALAKEVLRFGDAQWGVQTEDRFRQILEDYKRAANAGELAPLPASYQPSAVIHVPILTEKPYEFKESAKSQYLTFVQELGAANEACDEPRAFSKLVAELKTEIEKLSEKLAAEIADPNLHPQKRQSLEAQRAQLLELITPADAENPKSYPLRDLKALRENFDALSAGKNQDLHPTIRKIMFAWAFHKHGNSVADNITRLNSPDIDSLRNMREFVEHIVNRETFAAYFTDEKFAKRFSQLTGMDIINATISDYEKDRSLSAETLPMQFVPTKGLLQEFSGYLADACWAGKEPIHQVRPNAVTILIKQNVGKPSERIVGASLLISTVNESSGEPILMIRGLNPLENTINSISQEVFYAEFVNYVKSIAAKSGQKLAIALDDHSGGATTNRPQLFKHIAAKSADYTVIPVPNDGPQGVEFNNYRNSDYQTMLIP